MTAETWREQQSHARPNHAAIAAHWQAAIRDRFTHPHNETKRSRS